MEEKLDKYITELRARGVCVSSFMIKVEAMRILRLEAEQRNTEFKFRASDGWFSNFIKRKKFSLRIFSELCQVQTRIIDQLMKFRQQLIMLRQLVISQ